jgi:aldehyde:ferredoxin oxidoreductase
MHRSKAKMAKWSVLRKELHDSLSICNWMGPWVASPHKDRGYRGDDSIEAQLYSIVTGDKKDKHELDAVAERIFQLHRALTIRDMGTKEMRAKHDTVPDWVFKVVPGKPTFTEGAISLEQKDAETAVDMFYEEMGWDKTTGSPTSATYRKFGLAKVSDELGRRGLLPGA